MDPQALRKEAFGSAGEAPVYVLLSIHGQTGLTNNWVQVVPWCYVARRG